MANNPPKTIPKIIVSSGEPAGIGPDITIMASQYPFDAAVAVTGCPNELEKRAKNLGIPTVINSVSLSDNLPIHTPGNLSVIPAEPKAAITIGELDISNSQYVIDCINIATDQCLSGNFDAMVTAPVHKANINDAGIAFSGHTEWIAQRCGENPPVMMLANEHIRVCLATTHLPLIDVPKSITEGRLFEVIKIMNHDIGKLYGINAPRIAVCGLNPHAGEGGHLGMEEIEIIEPAVRKLKEQGLNLSGPVPADTIFTEANLQNVDAVLAMYHDQGLPVIKHSGFGEVVNITLGLPIIRTSVDHGTALDMAGTPQASESSLVTAINLAIKFAKNRIL